MENREEEQEIQFPVALLYAMDIDARHKQTIYNFAEDMGIENVPQMKYMNIALAVISDIDEENDPEEILEVFKGPVMISNFRIVTADMEGSTALLVEYESPVLEKYFDIVSKAYTELDHDSPEYDFVLSYDYEGDHDLDSLSFKFNQYLPFISGSTDISGYYEEDVLNAMMVGVGESDDL